LKTLAYIADPEDLVPDHVEVVGLLDDAIMLELLLRDQRHLLDAWRDFCVCRATLGVAAQPDARVRHAAKLARRRKALLERMRRRAAAPALPIGTERARRRTA
jgi:uncharacterized membrane protein YkvA (DUF1232 family)